jgi:hypothetical protein
MLRKELFHSEENVKITDCTQQLREVQSSMYPRVVFECKTYLVDCFITGNMTFHNTVELEAALDRANIPVEEFGGNGKKSVAHLLAELNLGQSNLFSFAEYPLDLYINKKVCSVLVMGI